MTEEIQIRKIGAGYLLLKAPLRKDNNFDRLNKVPGFKKWIGRELKFRPVASSLDYIYEQWPDAHWVGEAEEIIINHLKNVNEALEAKANKKEILEDDGSYEYKTIPYDHQRQAFLLSRDMPWFALLMEMGCGKSKILIDTACYLYSKGKIDCLVVIAPNGVHRNWTEIELKVHVPDWLEYKSDFYSAKHGKKRMAKVYDVLLQKEALPIIAFNVEGVVSQKAKDLLNNCIQNKKCMVIMDESTTIKSPGAKRTQAIIKSCKAAPYKRIANGAPITKGIEDLYSQFGFLSNDIIGYDSFTAFKRQYCEEVEQKVDPKDSNSKTYKKIVGYRNVDELVDKIDPYSMRVLKRNCLDLPDKVYKLWPVELTPQQKQAYIELKNEYITEIEGNSIEEEIALVRLLRLQQIACGWYPDEEGNLLPFPGGNPRMQALSEICNQVRENGEKAIIWARFKQDIYEIEKLLGKDAVSYHGDVDEEDRIKAGKRFQEDDSVRFMIAMLSSNSGSVRGHTWTAASVTIYYSNIFDLDPRMQSEDRMHRIGMGDKALYIDLMALGTIDRKIINALKSKKSVADLVTRDGPTGFLDFIKED